MVITNTGTSCIGYNHLPFLSGTTVTLWNKALFSGCKKNLN